MNPDDPLLRILACPLDKGPLHLLAPAPGADREEPEEPEEGTGDRRTAREECLYNPRLRRRYPIVDGIPQLLPSSGEQVPPEEHEKLLTLMSPLPPSSPASPSPAHRPDVPGTAP